MTIDLTRALGLTLTFMLSHTIDSTVSDYEEQPAVVDDAEMLPTVITGEPRTEDYPEPICSKCRIVVERSSSTGATFWLRYDDDVYLSLDGNIELTLLLADDSTQIVTIESVSLVSDDEITYELADGETWSWTEVSYVWVRVVPTA